MRKLRGFTLVEMVLSIGLLGVGLIGIFYFFANLLTSSMVTDQTIIAANLARETMETILARKDCDNSGCGYTTTLSTIQSGTYNASPVSGFSAYTITTTATEVDPDNDDSIDDFLDASPGSGYARVTVLVSWNAGQNTFTLVTLMANY